MVQVTSLSLDHEVTALFASERLDDPFPIWNRLREEAPVYEGGDVVVLTRYADIKAMLPDRKRYSARFHVAGSQPLAIVATFSPETQRMWHEIAAYKSLTLSRQAPKDHARLRGIAHRFFTPFRMKNLETVIAGFWDDLLKDAEAQEVYDHKQISQRMALRVITHIVGCPHVDDARVASMVERIAYFTDTNEARVREAYEGWRDFNEYIDTVIIDGYNSNPASNEFVEAVMNAEREDNLTPLELSAMVSELLFGGIETTTVLLSSGLLTLLEHRDQWEWLCQDPATRVPAAVEELFRYVSPAQWVPRTAQIDFEIGGVHVPEGHTVIGAVAAAHRDPAQYEKPNEFDATQSRQHLGLGIGPKFCLGASVVRAEARIAFTALAQHYPHLELAVDPSELHWDGGPATVRSLRELPVALGSRRP